jgi:hypothetical protein
MKFRTAVLIVVLLSLSALAALPGPAASDEGMYPISELKKLDLRAWRSTPRTSSPRTGRA